METMQNNIITLNVYIVNDDGKLCRIINTDANLIYEGMSIPILHISDNMIKKLLNRESLYFYDPRNGRINFFSDNIITMCNLDKATNVRISIELLEVGDMYILLSPGIWINNSENGTRYRLCDDSSLYNTIGLLSDKALGGKNFMSELKQVVERLSQPVEQSESASDNTNPTESEDSNDSDVAIAEE